ncbi:MAG TPA: hypothetical protein VGP82_17995, partial [Ktedonobacterales bacterium]|nr:hypothetical protein [Ktedonobacterales bacterium]
MGAVTDALTTFLSAAVRRAGHPTQVDDVQAACHRRGVKAVLQHLAAPERDARVSAQSRAGAA